MTPKNQPIKQILTQTRYTVVWASKSFLESVTNSSPTHSTMPPKCSKEFQVIFSYGPTTTQQQVYNRTSAGFIKSLQAHSSS